MCPQLHQENDVLHMQIEYHDVTLWYKIVYNDQLCYSYMAVASCSYSCSYIDNVVIRSCSYIDNVASCSYIDNVASCSYIDNVAIAVAI